MSVKADPSRSPMQRVAEQSKQEAQSAAVKRPETLAPASESSAVAAKSPRPEAKADPDRYAPAKASAAAVAPQSAAAVLEQRDGIRARRNRASDSPLIGAEPVKPAQAKPVKTSTVTSFDDDPFTQKQLTETVPHADFKLDSQGKPVGLEGPRVKIVEPETIGTHNQNGDVEPMATNPWSLPKPNAKGDFVFPNETRFPDHKMELDAQGNAVRNAQNLEVWKPQDLHAGQSTAFEAVNHVHRAGEDWAGRKIAWGDNGQLTVNAHEFMGMNAFYNPVDRQLHLGVVPYKAPGSSDVKMFEMATSWEVVGHEAGHALQDELKPNKGLVDSGYREWGESFADQLAMWSSLRDPDRIASVLKETGGDLSKPSSLSRVGEAFGPLQQTTDPLRDASNQLKVSDTTTQFHDRSQVLSGASYSIFRNVVADLRKNGLSAAAALSKGGEIMGTFLMRTTEHTPENSMTMEDVAKAYLKVDKEYFGGRYHKAIADEFTQREVFTKDSVKNWFAHEAQLPKMSLSPQKPTQAAAEKALQANLDALAPGKEFGLKVQQFHVDKLGQQIVRVQLMDGRGANAKPLENHGVLVFGKDGKLMDYHHPLPGGMSDQQAQQLLRSAHASGLDEKGTVSLIPKPGGGYTAQAVEQIKTKTDPHMQVFTLEEPAGQRREYFFKEQIQEHGKKACFHCTLPPGAKPVRFDGSST